MRSDGKGFLGIDEEHAAAMVAEIDACVGEASADELGEQFDFLVLVANALLYRALRCGRELHERGVTAEDGCRDLGSWLASRAGVSFATGHEWARAVDALRSLPVLSQRFCEGTLGVERVAAAAQLALAEPDGEAAPTSALDGEPAPAPTYVRADAVWAGEALQRSATSLRREAARARRVTRQRAADEAESNRVRVRHRPGRRGAHISATLYGDGLATFLTALDRSAERQPRLPDGTRQPVEQRRAAALVDLARRAITADADPDRATVVVFADLADLPDLADLTAAGVGDEPDHGVAPRQRPARSQPEIAGGDTISGDTLQRLACDCRLQLTALDADGTPRVLSSVRRTVPAWLHRQLLRRDRHCTFPGCDRTLFVQAHHITHWSRRGPTRLDNLLLLCSYHHTFTHEHGWSVVLHDGDVRWTRPDGRPHPAPPEALPPHLYRRLGALDSLDPLDGRPDGDAELPPAA
jgi:hypothetical protein